MDFIFVILLAVIILSGVGAVYLIRKDKPNKTTEDISDEFDILEE